MPVVIENNARMRAIGEEMFGNQDHADTFAYYLISYGPVSYTHLYFQ